MDDWNCILAIEYYNCILAMEYCICIGNAS